VCLARATDGKVKLSCEISAKDHIKFQIAYSDMLKLELDGLKKRRVPGPASRRAAPPASPRTRAPREPPHPRRSAALHDPPPPSARSAHGCFVRPQGSEERKGAQEQPQKNERLELQAWLLRAGGEPGASRRRAMRASTRVSLDVWRGERD